MAMPLYVPALPWRKSALAAYEDLDPAVRGRVAPLWMVPPLTGALRVRGARVPAPVHDDTAELRSHLAKQARALLNAHDDLFDLPGWVDALHVEDAPEATAAALWQRLEDSPLRPVTGPERGADDQLRAADAASLAGGGLGIRVLLDERPDIPHRTSLEALVARVERAVPALDLLLDLGSVVSATREAAVMAATAIELFAELTDWRSVVVLAGGFPEDLSDLAPGVLTEVPRTDWRAWQLVRAATRAGAGTPVVFGDYGVQHAQAANSPSAGGPPAWVHLRYTVEDAYLVAKAPFLGARSDAARRAMARKLVGSACFRSRASRGENWLWRCATGTGGSGNAVSWIHHGHTQHISFVVRQLDASPFEDGR